MNKESSISCNRHSDENAMSCRICGHGAAVSLGQLPDCNIFAGQIVSPAIKGGRLWKCKVCGSMFRYPTLTSSEYLLIYEIASSDVWVGAQSWRQDFAKIYAYLINHPGGSILDIGCYSGAFLDGIPAKFTRFGIEPSISASRCAASKGIKILGKTLADLDTNQKFDVVVLIDVVEHMLDVESFLSEALAHVKDNGQLILSTGNPDNFFWKWLLKGKFWYCSYPEHLVFPSYKYYCEYSKRHDLSRPEQIRFRYTGLKFVARYTRLLRYMTFSYFPFFYQGLRKIRRIIANSVAPINFGAPVSPIGIFTDHHVIVFKK